VILVSSDWHLRPGDDIPDFGRRFALLAQETRARPILVGDIFDVIPYGESAWHTQRGRDTVLRFLLLFPQGVEIVSGNHDPHPFLCRLLADYTRRGWVQVFRRLRWGSWLFVHGHQRSDWALWRYIAPEVVELATELCPRAFLWLMEKLGWAGRRRERLTPGERQRFSLLTEATHAAWLRFAERERLNVVIGHTHKLLVARWRRFDGAVAFLVDCGDIRDGYCIQIEEGREVKTVELWKASGRALAAVPR